MLEIIFASPSPSLYHGEGVDFLRRGPLPLWRPSDGGKPFLRAVPELLFN